jgi:hypothetical protein
VASKVRAGVNAFLETTHREFLMKRLYRNRDVAMPKYIRTPYLILLPHRAPVMNYVYWIHRPSLADIACLTTPVIGPHCAHIPVMLDRRPVDMLVALDNECSDATLNVVATQYRNAYEPNQRVTVQASHLRVYGPAVLFYRRILTPGSRGEQAIRSYFG